MYERFYGLRETPFDLTADPRYLFLTSRHREALSTLTYGVGARKPVTLLLGEAGTGKTTLIKAALETFQQGRISAVYLSNPTLTRSEFFEFLTAGFGLNPRAAGSKTRFLWELDRTLNARHGAGVGTALIIDEAQSLPAPLLEEVRLLANMETRSDKLLPVVLVGQPELADRLNESSLRHLKQRIALRCQLAPLDLRETGAYVAMRLRIAGGDSVQIFTRDAIAEIYAGSRGIPRSISVIADNALVCGFAADRRPIDRDIVIEVCRDFDLQRTSAVERPAACAVASTTPAAAAPDAPPSRAERPERGDRAVAAAPQPARELFAHFAARRRFSFF